MFYFSKIAVLQNQYLFKNQYVFFHGNWPQRARIYFVGGSGAVPYQAAKTLADAQGRANRSAANEIYAMLWSVAFHLCVCSSKPTRLF